MTTLGPDLDTARARVVAHGLAAKAFAQLTPVVTELGLSLEALGPVKQLQKRFFSDAPWTADDDEALADTFGPGVEGTSSFELEPGLTLWWGWEDGRFRLRVASDEPASGDERVGRRRTHRRTGRPVRRSGGARGDPQPAHDPLRHPAAPRRTQSCVRLGRRCDRPARRAPLRRLRRGDRCARRTRFRGGDDLAA